jgi:UDPglucose 6-dehydrogenase
LRAIGHPRLETRAVTRDSLAEDGRVKGRVAQMRIAMIGTGYVGLVSGVCFSDFGHDVVCVDKDPRKIAMLEGGEVPIYEPGLDALMAKNVEAGRLSFTTDLAAAVDGAEAVFIAVGTPTRRGDGHADLTYVMAAAEEVARALTGYAVIVTKSTVPVGTNRKVKQAVARANPSAEFDVASNPEFLREGAAIDDFMKPDRVVVGVQTERAGEVMAEIYRPLFLREFPIVTTDLESAEMIKYAANAFLATKITFINEIAALCERVGADVKEVSKGIGLDGRIGNKFLHAGPGYGGSCFPKDTSALARIGQEHAVPQSIVETVIRVNDVVKHRMIEKLRDLCDGSFNGKTVAVLGVTFKPNTDDMRDAPSLTIVPALVGGGAKVRVVDPQGRREGEALLPGVAWLEDPYKAAQNADLVVILTEWNEFRALDLKKLARKMAVPRMADLRNVYSPRDAKRAGFEAYDGIGRPMMQQPKPADQAAG